MLENLSGGYSSVGRAPDCDSGWVQVPLATPFLSIPHQALV